MITQAELQEHVHYNPETGIFTWLKHSRKSKVGTTAGTLDALGYVRIMINKKVSYAHRLAWLYMFGSVPPMLDHKDNVRSHNWLDNLRETSYSGNMRNRGSFSNNKSGVKGVSFVQGKWRAACDSKGVRYNLGSYNTLEEAKQVRVAFAQQHHGEFFNPGGYDEN